MAGGTVAADAALAEAVSLLGAIGLMPVDADIVPLARPQPATLLGQGKVDELAARFAEDGIELVVVNGTLSPVQQRNLERAWKVKILDRTGLILEIFGRRAQTRLKDGCRSNSRTSIIRPVASCVAGPTSNVSAAASASSVARAKRRSRRIVA